MSDAPLCDFAGSLSVDLDRQDGWDSSLQLLWELEQKEPLQSDLPSSCANTTLDDSPAGYRAKAPNLNGTGTDRRLQNRRMAQKRFRLREKERKYIVDTELEHAQRELQHSRTCQAAMQAELQVLKGLAHTWQNSQQLLSHQHDQHDPASQSSHKKNPVFGLPDHVAWLIKSSVTTVISRNHACCAPTSVEELPIEEMKKLYQATVDKLSRSLSICDQDTANKPLACQLSELSVQACSLLLCQICSNLRGLTDLLCTGMAPDDLIPVSYANNKSAVLDALHYSPRQIADLLVMRQLFFTKLGHLRHARETALDALSGCSDDLHQTKVLTVQMQALVEEQYHALLQFGAACLFGIHTARQLAMGIVYSFPQLFFCHQLLDALGECHGAPSKQCLMSLCVPELEEVTWDDVAPYLQGITCHTLKDYFPFLKGDALQVLKNDTDCAAH